MKFRPFNGYSIAKLRPDIVLNDGGNEPKAYEVIRPWDNGVMLVGTVIAAVHPLWLDDENKIVAIPASRIVAIIEPESTP